MLNGTRVRLRPSRENDLPDFVRWLNDPEVAQYLARPLFPLTEMAERKWYESTAVNLDRVHLVIEVRTSENEWVSIGACGIEHIDHVARNGELGMFIGEKAYQEKGYGTESLRLLIDYAFTHLNFHRVNAGAHAFNERSLKMQRRVGLVEEGRRRQTVYRNGAYHDSIVSGLLRSEWEKLRS